MKIGEKARDQMWHILHDHKKEDEWATVVFDILSIKELAIVDREAKLPSAFDANEDAISAVEYKKRLKGWVEEIKE